jgi:hypothetical protein
MKITNINTFIEIKNTEKGKRRLGPKVAQLRKQADPHREDKPA